MTKRKEATDLLRLCTAVLKMARSEHRRANRLYEGRWCWEQRQALNLLEQAAKIWQRREALFDS